MFKVCAPSNAAVDSLALKIIEIKESCPELSHISFVRSGMPDKIHLDVQEYGLEVTAGKQAAQDVKGQKVLVKLMKEAAEKLEVFFYEIQINCKKL